MVQTLGLVSPQDRLWSNFVKFSERLSQRLREELERKGIRIHDVSVELENHSNDEVRYRVEIDIMIYEAVRVYYDGIYESCNDAASEAVASGEITEEEVGNYVESCVDEEVGNYDEEYGEPPFELTYRKSYVEAKLETIVEDDNYTRSYIDVLRIIYRQSPYSWVFERASDRDIERMVEVELEQILPEVMRLYQAVKILYER